MELAGWIAAAYLAGSVPFGLLFGKLLARRDLRTVGSGNIGATNALRAGGPAVGALTLAADLGKGTLPVWLALRSGMDDAALALVAAAAFLGHLYPIWLRFRGGKGVATMFGVALPWLTAAAALAFAIWLTALRATRYVSVASIMAGLSLPLAAWIFGAAPPAIALCVFLAVMTTWRHRSNIRRLLDGREPTTGQDRAARLQDR
ncbi:MAG: glycerol-3-phosphate 1-O-acyltransferase PlsY [Mariprofundaceae bacterium]